MPKYKNWILPNNYQYAQHLYDYSFVYKIRGGTSFFYSPNFKQESIDLKIDNVYKAIDIIDLLKSLEQ